MQKLNPSLAIALSNRVFIVWSKDQSGLASTKAINKAWNCSVGWFQRSRWAAVNHQYQTQVTSGLVQKKRCSRTASWTQEPCCGPKRFSLHHDLMSPEPPHGKLVHMLVFPTTIMPLDFVWLCCVNWLVIIKPIFDAAVVECHLWNVILNCSWKDIVSINTSLLSIITLAWAKLGPQR